MKLRIKIINTLKNWMRRLTSEPIDIAVHKITHTNNFLMFQMTANSLTEKALNSSILGIAKEKYCGENEVIVSMTTYWKRLSEVHLAIESVMQGSMKPNRIILWLSDELRSKDLPITLKRQMSRGLEINYCKDIKSYTKLIPTLMLYPDACIITIDDDAIYPYDLIENMVNAYRQNPNYIYTNRMHRIIMGDNRRPLSYLKWDWCANNDEASHKNFFTGVGGVLYPPSSLNNEVFNESVFMSICESADDVWFNAMALLNGTKVKKVFTHSAGGTDYLLNNNVQDTALWKFNANSGTGDCKNDTQIAAVYSRYNLYEKLNESS